MEGGIVIRKGRDSEIQMNMGGGYSFTDTEYPGAIPPLTVAVSFPLFQFTQPHSLPIRSSLHPASILQRCWSQELAIVSDVKPPTHPIGFCHVPGISSLVALTKGICVSLFIKGIALQPC